MTQTQRINQLKAIEISLANEDGGGWLARTVRESIIPPRPVVDQIAALLTSGATGFGLLAQLRDCFGAATRQEVFHGVAMAVSLFEVDRIGLLHDLLTVEARLSALETAQAND